VGEVREVEPQYGDDPAPSLKPRKATKGLG